jgi:Trk-type K+ transport system membrane component
MAWKKIVDEDDADSMDHPHHKTITSKIQGFLTFLIFRRIDFKFYWAMYYVITCLVFAIIISTMDNISYMDGVFMATSAMTGSGLSTVPMSQLSPGTFMILGILMMIGCAPFMLIPVILYRRHSIGEVIMKVEQLRHQKLLPKERQLTRLEQSIIQDYHRIDDALGVLGIIIVVYYIGFIVMGIGLLYIALHLQPLQAELQHRGFTYFDNAAFLAVSAFANAGITISSDNLIGMSHNPCAYIVLTWLIIAGNTALPIFLRIIVSTLTFIESKVFSKLFPSTQELIVEDPQNHHPQRKVIIESSRGKYRRTLQFILDHPRRLTTHMFSHLQTKVLAVMVLSLIILQYVFFLGSTMNRRDALFHHSPGVLAGIGYFQTLSTRSAGFAMMDLRELNQGLLFIYAIMMYMSSFPFVATLQKYSKEKTKVVDESVGGNGENEMIENDMENGQMRSLVEGGVGVGESTKSLQRNKFDQFTSAKVDISRDIEMVAGVNLTSEADDRIIIANDRFDSLPSSMKMRHHNHENHGNKKKEKDPEILENEHDNSTLGADVEDEEVYSASSSSGSYISEDKMKASTINKRFLKHYFFRHSFFLILAVLVCAFSEDRILSDPSIDVNLWYIMFEIISAYGNVGLSLGVPGQVISLSGAFTPAGKCMIIFIMWLGKHRGLPSSSDEVVDFKCEDYLSACRYFEYIQQSKSNVDIKHRENSRVMKVSNSDSGRKDGEVVTYHPFHV